MQVHGAPIAYFSICSVMSSWWKQITSVDVNIEMAWICVAFSFIVVVILYVLLYCMVRLARGVRKGALCDRDLLPWIRVTEIFERFWKFSKCRIETEQELLIFLNIFKNSSSSPSFEILRRVKNNSARILILYLRKMYTKPFYKRRKRSASISELEWTLLIECEAFLSNYCTNKITFPMQHMRTIELLTFSLPSPLIVGSITTASVNFILVALCVCSNFFFARTFRCHYFSNSLQHYTCWWNLNVVVVVCIYYRRYDFVTETFCWLNGGVCGPSNAWA